jgi:DNA (cytosine-5)-methyltransferase 1
VLTVGSLFSGIGGLDLGLERSGMEVIWQSEIDPYASKVLAKHWPKVPNYGDIKTINWGNIVRPDVICGGYPCQPFSTAGKRNGANDSRHLWPWVREAISELRPRYAILENVRGHITLGLSEVLGDLASIGYDAEWQIVSANSVGAPHLRERIIILAYPNSGRQQERQSQAKQNVGVSSSSQSGTNTIRELANTDNSGRLHRQPQIFTADRWFNALSFIGSGSTDVANANHYGLSAATFGGSIRTPTDKQSARQDNPTDTQGRSGLSRKVADTKSVGLQGSSDLASIENQKSGYGVTGDNCGTQPRNDWWKVEPNVGRVAHGIPSRVDRLRGLGNAVVPQVAELIGRMVIDYDTN